MAAVINQLNKKANLKKGAEEIFVLHLHRIEIPSMKYPRTQFKDND